MAVPWLEEWAQPVESQIKSSTRLRRSLPPLTRLNVKAAATSHRLGGVYMRTRGRMGRSGEARTVGRRGAVDNAGAQAGIGGRRGLAGAPGVIVCVRWTTYTRRTRLTRQTRMRAAPGGRRHGAGVDGGAQLGDAASGAMADGGDDGGGERRRSGLTRREQRRGHPGGGRKAGAWVGVCVGVGWR